jgi:hypothetical protein
MIPKNVGLPTPGVYSVAQPVHCVHSLDDVLYLGSTNLRVGWLKLLSGKSEFQLLTHDPQSHKDDQIISIQSFVDKGSKKLVVQSKGGWFGKLSIRELEGASKKIILGIEALINTDFIGFCTFPILEFGSILTEEYKKSFQTKNETRNRLLLTNSLDQESQLSFIEVRSDGFSIRRCQSETSKFIDAPVGLSLSLDNLREANRAEKQLRSKRSN